MLEGREGAASTRAIAYELVPGPCGAASATQLEALSGQRQYPVIVLEDGTVYREQSKDMEKRIRDGHALETPAKLRATPGL